MLALRSCHLLLSTMPCAIAQNLRITKNATLLGSIFVWRRVGDSNPRMLLHINSFQDCRNRPLCQLSATKVQIPAGSANNDVDFLT
jgi:hypothetical protein